MVGIRRSMLFIPGNNPGMIQNASVFGADSIIFDLEDAVAIDEKDSARQLLKNALDQLDFQDIEVVVRINQLENVNGIEDLKMILPSRPDVILVPKSSVKNIKTVSDIISLIESKKGFLNNSIKLMALIETADGVENISSILNASDRLIGVLFGAEDFTADMGIERSIEGNEITYARNKIAIACKVNNLNAIDTPFTDLDDDLNFIIDIKNGKSYGMTGKAAINPRQIERIHDVFNPSIKEIKTAYELMDAVEDAKKKQLGVFSYEGRMVDAPIIKRAENIIEMSKAIGLEYEGEIYG